MLRIFRLGKLLKGSRPGNFDSPTIKKLSRLIWRAFTSEANGLKTGIVVSLVTWLVAVELKLL